MSKDIYKNMKEVTAPIIFLLVFSVACLLVFMGFQAGKVIGNKKTDQSPKLKIEPIAKPDLYGVYAFDYQGKTYIISTYGGVVEHVKTLPLEPWQGKGSRLEP